MEPSVWTRSVPFVEDGQAVSAAVTNAPTQVLADRTAALKAIVDAITAGEQLLVHDAPLAAGVEEGHVVYLNADTLRYDLAQALYQSLQDTGGRLRPADKAVFSGVVTRKSTAYAGDILFNGLGQLGTAAILRLFNGASPQPGVYYLSNLVPGTVETAPPTMLVRVLQYTDGGIVRVLSPDFEPETHSHRDYRLYAGDWKAVAAFDPSIVPAGAYFGYDLTAPLSMRQFLAEAILPNVGEPEYVWAYFRNSFEAGTDPYASQHIQEPFTLTSVDIGAGGVVLAQAPTDPSKTTLLIRNSGVKKYGVDYGFDPVNPRKLIWTGYALDGQMAVGDALIVLFAIVYGTGGGSSESGDTTLAGRHVNDLSVMLNENGIWWFDPITPPQDILMTLTIADARQLALIFSVFSRTPGSLDVINTNGRVGVGIRQFERVAGYNGAEVVKDIDFVNGLMKVGPVVSQVSAGLGIKVTPVGGTGAVTIDLALFYDWMLEAGIYNLNNAVTRTESPYVFTEFPINRISSINLKVQLPNIPTDSRYSLAIWALFIGTGVEEDAPLVSCSLLPTPLVTGSVVYAAPGFPVVMGTIPAGTDVYLVECPVLIDAAGLASGQVLYELLLDNPAVTVKMLGSGIRITPKS